MKKKRYDALFKEYIDVKHLLESPVHIYIGKSGPFQTTYNNIGIILDTMEAPGIQNNKNISYKSNEALVQTTLDVINDAFRNSPLIKANGHPNISLDPKFVTIHSSEIEAFRGDKIKNAATNSPEVKKAVDKAPYISYTAHHTQLPQKQKGQEAGGMGMH